LPLLSHRIIAQLVCAAEITDKLCGPPGNCNLCGYSLLTFFLAPFTFDF